MGDRMVIGIVIAHGTFTKAPINIVLFLAFTITDPEEMHMICLGMPLFQSVVHNGCSSSIGGLDGGWGLFMAQMLLTNSDWLGFFVPVLFLVVMCSYCQHQKQINQNQINHCHHVHHTSDYKLNCL